MAEQEKEQGEGGEQPATEGEAKAKPEAKAEQPADEAQAERSAPEAKAKPERPARETKAPAREPPPPGGIADLIRNVLPDVQMEAYQGISDVIVEIGRDDVPNVMPALKHDARLDLKFLRAVFGVDHQQDGLDVIYQLVSLEKNHEVTVKTRLPPDDLKVASVTPVWQGANWHERETRDMFGIEFDGHPHLVPLLLPEDMTDHFPLRKDNPLAEIEEWQGELVEAGAGNGDEESEE